MGNLIWFRETPAIAQKSPLERKGTTPQNIKEPPSPRTRFTVETGVPEAVQSKPSPCKTHTPICLAGAFSLTQRVAANGDAKGTPLQIKHVGEETPSRQTRVLQKGQRGRREGAAANGRHQHTHF